MPKIKLALFQARPAFRSVEQSLADLEEALSQAALQGVNLVVTPELFLSGYGCANAVREMAQTHDSAVLEAIAQIATKTGVGLALGYPERDGETLYNSAVVFGPKGECLHRYRKTILPNEFEKSCFETGNGPNVFDFLGVRCSVVICYDIEFPELARTAAINRAELIVVPTALQAAWRIVADSVIPTRAYENGVFVAYCDFANNTEDSIFSGASTVCAPNGSHLAMADGEETLLIAEVDTHEVTLQRNNFDFLKHVPLLASALAPTSHRDLAADSLPRNKHA